MTNNAKKLERFEKRLTTIQDHLAEIKKEVDADKLKKEKDKISADVSLIKDEMAEHLDELKKDVDTNADDIKKLEDLSKKVESFSGELDTLKDEILKKEEDKKEKEKEKEKKDDDEKEKEKEGEPSLFASIFYGGLIANTLGKLPGIGKSITSWTEKKMKASAQEDADEKSGKKEKKGFLRRAWNTVFWSGIVTGALWLGKKLVPDSWTKEIKSWLPWTDEAKAKKEQEENKGKENDKAEEDKKSEKNKEDEEMNNSDSSSAEKSNQEGSLDNQSNEQEKNQLSPEEKKVTAEVQRMYSEGYSELYILMKMYQLGFIPKFNMETWRGNTFGGKLSYIAQGGPFTKMLDKTTVLRGDINRWMIGRIKYNQEELMKYKLDAIANNKTSLVKEYETRYNILAEMQSDLDKGSITSLKDFETKYGRTVTDKFGRKHFSRLPSDLIKEGDKLIDVEKNIKTLETDINKLKNEAKLKLDELEKKAKLDPKQKTKFQAEAKKIVAEYNKKIGEAEQKIGTSLSKVTISELAELEKRSPLVKGIVKINDGLDKFAEKTKLGKFMIGFSVLGLVGKGVGGETSWGQVGLEAADLATGMVPFAGGAYDVWTSITGKGIAGELSTTDRWIRGATGAVSVVLDVAGLFTFGIGNGASAGLKAAVRGGTKMTKVAKGVKVAAETLNTGMKLATYGVLGITLVSQTVPMLTSLYETVDKKVTADIPVN